MIDPQRFREQWRLLKAKDAFIAYTPAMFEGVDIPQHSAAFLLEAGLPESAAPYLSLDQPAPASLPTVAERWKIPTIASRYREIGSDGEGSPLCIEEGSGKVLLLDHDSQFVPVLMNTSVTAFAACLLRYQQFVQKVRAMNGPEAFLDNNIPEGLRQELMEALKHEDEAAIQEDSFWQRELLRLEEEW